MVHLREMFFIIENLDTSSAVQYFTRKGFEPQIDTDGSWLFCREVENKKIESVLLQELNNRFNYFKISFQNQIEFSKNLTEALINYGFFIVEDNAVKVLRNDKYVLLFSQYYNTTFNITLAIRNKELENINSLKIVSPLV